MTVPQALTGPAFSNNMIFTENAQAGLFKKLLKKMSSSVSAFSPFFPGNDSFQIPERNGKVCRSESLPTGLLDRVAGLLNKLETCRLTKLDQINSRVLKEPPDVIARTVSIIFKSLCLSGKVSLDWETSHPSSGRMRRRI